MGAEPQLDLPAPPDTATGRKRDATGQSRQKHGPYLGTENAIRCCGD